MRKRKHYFFKIVKIRYITKKSVKVIYKNKVIDLHRYQFLRQGDPLKIKSGLIGRNYGISRKGD